MAVRRPLVLVSGELREIPGGDTIPTDVGAAPVDSPVFTTKITSPFVSHRGSSGAALVDSWTAAGDTHDRFSIFNDGYLRWGPGNAVGDAWLYRDAAGSLRTNSSLRVDGLITASRLVKPPQTVTYAASVALDPTLGDNFKITATGALALNVSTTGATDTQTVVLEVLASAANRTVTMNAAIVLTSGQAAAYTVISGKVGFFTFRYSALSGNIWACVSMQQEI